MPHDTQQSRHTRYADVHYPLHGSSCIILCMHALMLYGLFPHLQEDDKALHKCQQDGSKFERLKGTLPDEQRPTGFCSSITVGSLLPFKTAIMKGSVVELLARR